jgi:hypothetical protein
MEGTHKVAYINIKAATVESVYEGKGFRATTQYKSRDGEDRKEQFKVWTDTPVAVGDVVDVSGTLTVRVEEFTGQDGNQVTVAAIHVNNPKIEALL